MKLKRTFLVILTLLITFQVCFGQEFVEDENWIGEIAGGQSPFLQHSLKNYTKEDVFKAKQKLKLIRESSINDEWEGSYSLLGELSDTKLILDSEIGFINYYIYTCAIDLRALNYGSLINKPDSITLVSEKSQPPFYRTGKTGQKLIKVKWGDRHYLVEEERLEVFSELAAGYYGIGKNEKIEVNGETFETQIAIWNSFWVKTDDLKDKTVANLPQLPYPYEKLTKLPIETKIISLGKYEKDKPTEEPVMTYSRRYVTIGAGKNSGIKPEMEFYVPDLEERIKIVKVSDKTAIGVLERWLDSETREESCFKVGEDFPCKLLKVGMKVKTVPDEFLED